VLPVADVTDLAPGQLLAGKKEVLVGTGGHAVRLTEVTPQGKRAMAAADWARGARLDSRTVLGGTA
jgi:methionyl-tRNA formyltransferase